MLTIGSRCNRVRGPQNTFGARVRELLAAEAAKLVSSAPLSPPWRRFARFEVGVLSGCALGVSRNREVVYQNGYGMANLESAPAVRELRDRVVVQEVYLDLISRELLSLPPWLVGLTIR